MRPSCVSPFHLENVTRDDSKDMYVLACCRHHLLPTDGRPDIKSSVGTFIAHIKSVGQNWMTWKLGKVSRWDWRKNAITSFSYWDFMTRASSISSSPLSLTLFSLPLSAVMHLLNHVKFCLVPSFFPIWKWGKPCFTPLSKHATGVFALEKWTRWRLNSKRSVYGPFQVVNRSALFINAS